MNDLINRTDAISRQDAMTLPVLPKEYRQYQTTNLDDAYDLGWDDCQMHLNSLPSVQQEPKTGKWIKTTKHHADDKQEFDYYEITCSVCGSRPEKAWHLTPYCPNCGAKMKAKEEER